MRRTGVSSSLVLLAAGIVLLCATAPALADDDQAPTPSPATTVVESPTGAPALVASANREVQQLVATSRRTQGWSPHVVGSTKTWIHRHPVWFGALIGAAGGCAIAWAALGAEGAWVGTFGGGAAGAVVGAVVSR